MAIYSVSVKAISRSSGRSATAAAAYRTGERVTDQRTGEVHNYRRRSGVAHVAMLLPANAPAMTTSQLWSAAELAEKRKNSTVARELVVALPHELTPGQRATLAEQITEQLVQRYQVAAQVAVHTPSRGGDQRNHHAHILFTTRSMGSDGQLGAKTRLLDDIKTGPTEVKWIREMVSAETNQALDQAGSDARIDERSLSGQGIDRIATTHEGPRVTAIRRECEREQRGPLGECDVIQLNDARRLPPAAQLESEAQELDAEILDLEQHRHVQALRQQLAELDALLTKPAPASVSTARKAQQEVKERLAVAAAWHESHPLRSRLSRWTKIKPKAELQADAARQVYEASQARQEAVRWRDERLEAKQRLQDARKALLADPGIAEAMGRLDQAARSLRRAEGLCEQRRTWAKAEERPALAQVLDDQAALRQDIEAARSRIPTRVEARELDRRAKALVEQMERWEQRHQANSTEPQAVATEKASQLAASTNPRYRGPR